jgi:two-component system nitrate/nitrite sensor histidine kinase NarX
MTFKQTRWGLGAKLALVGTPFLLLALLSTALTLWVSWQLDGGAAAVNEAGRMRMQAYRMALSVGSGDVRELPRQIAEFNESINLLRSGDPDRPLFVPWDDKVGHHFMAVEKDWGRFHAQWLAQKPTSLTALRADTVEFAADIDTLVTSIEAHMSRWTAILHMLQMGVLVLAVLGAAFYRLPVCP